jgi:hypothetical protein
VPEGERMGVLDYVQVEEKGEESNSGDNKDKK